VKRDETMVDVHVVVVVRCDVESMGWVCDLPVTLFMRKNVPIGATIIANVKPRSL
jgi:hypothetical protein